MMIGMGDDSVTIIGSGDTTGAGSGLSPTDQAAQCTQLGWVYDAGSNSCIPGGTGQDAATSCPVAGAVLAGGVCINPTGTTAATSNTTTYLMLGFAAIAAIALAGSFSAR